MSLTKVTFSMIDAPVFNVADFGAVGNGVANDAVALQAAVAAAAGGNLVFEPGKTYLCQDELLLQPNTNVDLQGSTVVFDALGAKYNFKMNNDCTIRNGTVRYNNTTNQPAVNGSHCCPITVGSFNAVPGVGNSNVIVENMTLYTKRPDGQCISVYSDSTNVLITNCVIYNDGTAKNGIVCHWSSDDGGNPPSGTRHPSGVKIVNTVVADMQVGVYLSAAYQIEIDNCKFYDCTTSGVTAYRGDFSNVYAPASVAPFVGKNISITNSIMRGCVAGVIIDGIDGLTAAQQIMGVNIDNCHMYGPTAGSASDVGIKARGTSSVFVKSTIIEEFDGYGVDFNGDAENITFDGCTITGNALSAIYARDTDDIVNVTIQNSNIYKNAASSGLSYKPAVRIGALCKNWHVVQNTFGAVAGETQGTSVSLIAGAVGITVANNHCYGAVDYAFRTTGATSLLTTANMYLNFQNNTAESGITVYDGSPPSIVVNEQNRQVWFVGPPTTGSEGTWSAGDIIWDTTPSAGSFAGWICVSGGTPGTWKTFGAISV